MQEQRRLNDDDRQIQQLLGRLRPAAVELTAVDILSEVSRRRLGRQLWSWRAIAACLAAGFATSLLWRSQTVEKVVYRSEGREAIIAELPVPTAHPNVIAEAARLSGDDYVAKRNRILALGLSGLVPPSPAPSPQPPDLMTHSAPRTTASFLDFVKPLLDGARG